MGNQFNTRYLKKHKIAFIAAAVLIVVLFAALIVARSNKVKQNGQETAIAEQETEAAGQEQPEQGLVEKQETATEYETAGQGQPEQAVSGEQSEADREQLAAMDAYLDGADRTVMESQESLARAGLMQAETQQMLSDFSERISGMEDSLLCVENLIDRHAGSLADQSGEMAASISELAADGQDTISQVRSLSSSVTSLLSDIKTSGAENFASASEKLSGLQQALSEAEKSTKEYHDSLTKTINLLQKEGAEEHKELIQALDDARKETAGVLEKGFSGLESQMEQEYGGLMEKMGTIHDQITSTRKDISGLMKMIEESGEEGQEEIRKAFVSVTESLGQIRADYADACQEISVLIKTLELYKIGRIKLVMCNYSQYSSRYDLLLKGEVPNVFNPEFAGGSLMDINFYNVYLNVALFGKPQKAVYYSNIYRNLVDTSGILIMQYEGFVSESAGAKDTWGVNSVQIQGEDGYIYIKDGSNGIAEVRVVTREKEEVFNEQDNPDRWFYEVQNMTKMILENDHDSNDEKIRTMLDVMEVIESSRKAVGIMFQGDCNKD